MTSSTTTQGTPSDSSSFLIGDMQLRTRKKHDFDKVEAELPDPRSPALQMATMPAGYSFDAFGLLNKVVAASPFSRPVVDGDEVWLFDNTAFQDEDNGQWQAEFVTAIFKKEAKCKIADMVAGIAKAVQLADDAKEKETIEERVLPFLWDVRVAKTVKAGVEGARDLELKLGPTSVNGIATNVLSVRQREIEEFVRRRALVGKDISGILNMDTFHAEPEGWGIISDIDDTIKITMTSSPIGILKETFVNQSRPIPGMPDLYKEIQNTLPSGAAWFYLSASPYNLYPMLKDFRNKFYPPGTMILRDSSWKTISGLLSNLTVNTQEYKVDRMKKINGWLPKRKMICFGDSTQSDPEAYGEIYRTFPGWIQRIFIRKATDISEVGIEEKNEPQRFEKAFEGIPREVWHVFEDPTTIPAIIKEVVPGA